MVMIIAGESMEEVVRVMSSVGFDLEMRSKKVTALSGGWKMKVPPLLTANIRDEG